MKTIYLLGDVGFEITAKALQKELPKESKERVRIILDSPGGIVSEGIRVYNVIKSYKGDVEIIVGSMAASIASYIAMAVPKEKRKSFKNSSMMIHEARSGVLGGRARDFKIIHDRLSGVNSIIAEAYSENIGIEKDKILKMMSEDYYITGWEQLTDHNLISDVVDPKDIDFPEPTQEQSLFDFFFAQLDKEPDANSIKEKMYQAEERAMEDWRNNNVDLEKAVALLDISKTKQSQNQLPATGEDKNLQEGQMTLQDFLKSNPDAQAEYDKALAAAEAKGAEPANRDRKRIADILNYSNVKLSNEAITAIESGKDAKDFAAEELTRERNLRDENKGKDSPFKVLTSSQTPGEQDPKGKEEAKAQANADAEFDKRIEASAAKYAKGGIM